jgi:hypothetical protein
MAVTFDTKFMHQASSQNNGFSFVSNAGTVTGSVGANSNRVLIAMVKGYEPDGSGISDVASMAVTWNGVSMTSIGSKTGFVSYGLWLFGLIAPATGAQTLAATWSAPGAINTIHLAAWSLYEADQTTGWQNFASNNGTSNAPAQNVTSATGNIALAALANQATAPTLTAGTEDWNDTNQILLCSGAHMNGAATAGFTWTLSGSENWITAGVDVVAAATPSSSASPSMSGILLIERPVFDYFD